MIRLISALALAPALLTTAALAQTVTDDVSRQLWCGTALSIAFGEIPADIAPEEQAQATSFYEAGLALIALADAAHLEAGYTPEALAALKADLATEIAPVITGEVQEAAYSFEECIAILPADGGDASAPL